MEPGHAGCSEWGRENEASRDNDETSTTYSLWVHGSI